MGYTPNQWRDRSIIAQVAAKCVTELLRERADITSDDFNSWADVVFEKIWGLAGEPPPPSASEASEPQSVAQHSGGSRPNGGFKLDFGKHKGLTLDQVANSVDERGESGTGYLKWLFANTNNTFVRDKVGEFLG